MAYKTEFGEAVRKAIGERTYREIARDANLSPAYVADMVQGRVPKREVVIDFATATGADLNELLVLGGLEPETPVDYFHRLYRDLCRRHRRLIPYPSAFMGGELILRSHEEADQLIRAMEEGVEEGIL